MRTRGLMVVAALLTAGTLAGCRAKLPADTMQRLEAAASKAEQAAMRAEAAAKDAAAAAARAEAAAEKAQMRFGKGLYK